MPEDRTYNGWTNHATWAIGLHFEFNTLADIESAKEFLDEEYEKLPMVMKDLCDLSEVNWDEITANAVASFSPDDDDNQRPMENDE